MYGQTVTFDGHVLNDLFYVGDIEIGLPDFRPEMVERIGAHGAFLRSTKMGGPTIAIPLTVMPRRGHEPREALSTLLSWMDVDTPRVLTLSRDGGLSRVVIPSGAPEMLDDTWGDRLVIEFVQLDPWLTGVTATTTVPSAGSKSFTVGGDCKTPVRITSTAAKRNSTTRLWGLRLDDGDYLRVTLPTSSATAVTLDCGERTCTVGGNVTAPTLDSDWLELTPGTHVMRNDVGSGACTLSWVERWHR